MIDYCTASKIVANAKRYCYRPPCRPFSKPLRTAQYLQTIYFPRLVGIIVDETLLSPSTSPKNVRDNFSVSACTIDNHLILARPRFHLRSAPNFSMVAWPCWLIPFATDYFFECRQENSEIKPNTPVIHVPNVPIETFVPM